MKTRWSRFAHDRYQHERGMVNSLTELNEKFLEIHKNLYAQGKTECIESVMELIQNKLSVTDLKFHIFKRNYWQYRLLILNSSERCIRRTTKEYGIKKPRSRDHLKVKGGKFRYEKRGVRLLYGAYKEKYKPANT